MESRISLRKAYSLIHGEENKYPFDEFEVISWKGWLNELNSFELGMDLFILGSSKLNNFELWVMISNYFSENDEIKFYLFHFKKKQFLNFQ